MRFLKQINMHKLNTTCSGYIWFTIGKMKYILSVCLVSNIYDDYDVTT